MGGVQINVPDSRLINLEISPTGEKKNYVMLGDRYIKIERLTTSLATVRLDIIQQGGDSISDRIFSATPPFKGNHFASISLVVEGDNSTTIKLQLTDSSGNAIPRTMYKIFVKFDRSGFIESYNLPQNYTDIIRVTSPDKPSESCIIFNDYKNQTNQTIPLGVIQAITTYVKYDNPLVIYKVQISPSPIVYPDGRIQFGIKVNFLLEQQNTYSLNSVNLNPVVEDVFAITPSVNKLKMISSCPRIVIRAETDFYTGEDLGQVIMQVEDDKTCYSNYPLEFWEYVKAEGCGLVLKAINISDNLSTVDYYTVLNSLLNYGLLRYFLWRLIKGKFNLNILLSAADKIFYEALVESKYSCYLDIFQLPAFVRAAEYFY